MPTWLAKFIVDFVETAIAAVLALNIAFPNDVDQTKQIALVVGMAVIGALVSAVRRAYPDFIGWLRVKLGATP